MKGDMLLKAVESVTNPWRKQRKKEERGRPEVKARRRRVLCCEYEYSTRVTIKEAAYDCMSEAYQKASAGGTLPAHARQIMYAARPTILENSMDRYGNTPELRSEYFTQTVLPAYMAEHPSKTAGWDVVFDARGNLTEPHTKKRVPLGTLDVRRYLRDIARGKDSDSDVSCEAVDDNYPTCGPANRFGAVLFIEKEGFLPLFKAVNLEKRYDISIMSTKGMSVVAARQLVETVCSIHDVPLLILRDFDKAGFAIAASFQKDTRRYQFARPFEVVDFGLRLDDVQAWNLVSEEVSYRADPSDNLEENDATPEEIAYLCEGGAGKHYYGQRVELNSFPSDDLIKWIESKLDEQGVKKIVPDDEMLKVAYARAIKVAVVNNAIQDALGGAEDAAEEHAMPEDLKELIRTRLDETPETAWDSIVSAEAQRAVGEGSYGGDGPDEKEAEK